MILRRCVHDDITESTRSHLVDTTCHCDDSYNLNDTSGQFLLTVFRIHSLGYWWRQSLGKRATPHDICTLHHKNYHTICVVTCVYSTRMSASSLKQLCRLVANWLVWCGEAAFVGCDVLVHDECECISNGSDDVCAVIDPSSLAIVEPAVALACGDPHGAWLCHGTPKP